MKRHISIALLFIGINGCASTVLPRDDAAMVDAAFPDADAARSDTVIAMDVPPLRDTGTSACSANSQCGPREVCEFAPGCGQTSGRCVSDDCHSLPVAPQYCGCDGRTIQQVSACLPDRPYRGEGPCPDAGTARRFPTARMVWQSPGGIAGWGPAIMVTGDGVVRIWNMRTEFDPAASMPPADRTLMLTEAMVDGLFERWTLTSLSGLPHAVPGGECYPRVDTRLCETCPFTRIDYTVPSALLPEMQSVWDWFDVVRDDSPRHYCSP